MASLFANDLDVHSVHELMRDVSMAEPVKGNPLHARSLDQSIKGFGETVRVRGIPL